MRAMLWLNKTVELQERLRNGAEGKGRSTLECYCFCDRVRSGTAIYVAVDDLPGMLRGTLT